jgi:hypothetical protein
MPGLCSTQFFQSLVVRQYDCCLLQDASLLGDSCLYLCILPPRYDLPRTAAAEPCLTDIMHTHELKFHVVKGQRTLLLTGSW